MKPLLMRHSEPLNESFKVWRNASPYKHNPWHYHPEYEITYIKKGNGVLYIGDEMIEYKDDDIIMIGSNLPHEMRSAITVHPDLLSESISIHFNEDFLGTGFSNLSEALVMKNLLQKSLRGIKIGSANSQKKTLIENIDVLIESKGLLKISKLLEIIYIISECTDVQYLSSNSFINSIEQSQNHKINKVYEYVMKNFKNDISINEVASTINMIPTSFCRFFKERTNKQFIKFLTEIRMGYACRLLLEDKLSIAQIAFESGFGTVSNFNKQFKKVKGTTPSLFIKNYYNKTDNI